MFAEIIIFLLYLNVHFNNSYRRRRTGNYQKEKALQAEAATVEHLAHVRRTHQARFANMIGQHSTERHNDRHYQMRQCAEKSKLQQS